MMKTSELRAEELCDSELDQVIGGAAPAVAITQSWTVKPEFHSVFSRYVIGRYAPVPE